MTTHTTNDTNTPQDALNATNLNETTAGDNLTAETLKNEIRANDGPTARPCKVDELPDTIQREGKFCCWHYVLDGGRWTKKPIDPRTGRAGDSSNPAKFAGLYTAETYQNHTPGTGIGLGIFKNEKGANVGAIDIDNCRADDGTMQPLAVSIKEKMDSYTELSPSGHGIRILFTIPAGYEYDAEKYYIRNPHAGVEIYIPGMTPRFVTLTGDAVTPGRDLAERPDELQAVLDFCMKRPEHSAPAVDIPTTPLNLSDAELLDRIQGSRDEKTKDLMAGRWQSYSEYATQSDADLGLMIKLAYWTQRDAGQMERLFSQSGLADRDKWRNRESYRRDTIAAALERCDKVYDPDYKQKQEQQDQAAKDADQGKQDNAPAVDIQKTDADETPDGTGTDAEQQTEPDQQEKPDDLNQFLNEIFSERFRPIPTHLEPLDEALAGGLVSQTLVMLGAQPGAGKTALIAQICENIAQYENRKVIFLNLEMSKTQLLARSISRLIYTTRGRRFSPTYIMQGFRQDPDDKQVVIDAVEKYRATVYPNLRYNPDGLGADLDGILDYLDRLGKDAKKKGEPAPFIVCDYLHLLEGRPREDVQETIKRSVTGFKKYAIQYDSIVISIMAQSRKANSEKTSSMTAGRDSSSIEYSADVLLQLQGSDEKQEQQNGIVNLYLTKSRFTRANQDEPIKLKFLPGVSCFEDPQPWQIISKKDGMPTF